MQLYCQFYNQPVSLLSFSNSSKRCCLVWLPIKTELTWSASLAPLLTCVFAGLQLHWYMFCLVWIPIKTELTFLHGALVLQLYCPHYNQPVSLLGYNYSGICFV